MKTRTAERTQIALSGVNLSELRTWLKDIDGHSIVGPEYFLNMGLPADLVGKQTGKHEQWSGPPVTGVTEVGMVRALADLLEADTSSDDCGAMGEGTQSRGYAKAVLAALDSLTGPEDQTSI